MGTDISQDDLNNIKQLADQVVSLSEYRIQLSAPSQVAHERHRAQSHRHASAACGRQAHLPRRLADQPREAAGVDGADPRRGEGALPRAEDEARDAQVAV